MAFPPNFPVFKKRHLSFPQNRIRNTVNCTPYVWVKRVLGMKKSNRIQHFLSQGLAVQYILSWQKALKEKQSSGRAPFVAIFYFIWKAGENAYNSYICACIEMTLQQSIHHSPLNQGRSSPGHWRYHSHNFQCHRQHQWCQCLAAWSATVSLTCVCGLSLCSASGSRHFQTLMAQDMLNVDWINIYVIMTHKNMPHKIMHAALGDIS